MAGSRRTTLGRKLLLAAASTLLALAVAEAGLRYLAHRENRRTLEVAFGERRAAEGRERVALVDVIRPSGNDRIVYELIPGLEAVEFKGGLLSTDGRGFRWTAPEGDPADGPRARVLGLGDSVMFGHGISDGETYLAQLAVGLRESFPDIAWSVHNTAVPGYNTVQEVETLRAKGLALEPDLVILDVVANDLGLPPYVRSPVDVLDPGRSFLLDFALARLGLAEAGDPFLSANELAPATEAWEGGADLAAVPERYRPLVGREAFEAALDELAALRDEHGFRLVAVTMVEFLDPTPRLLEEVRRRGIPVISLFEEQRRFLEQHAGASPTMETMATSPLVVSPENPHPSALAHGMLAGRILRELEQAGLPERIGARAGE